MLKDSLWSKTHVAGDRTVHVLAATGKAKHAEKYGLAELDTSAGASSSSYALPDGTSVALPLGEMLSVLAMGQDKKRMKVGKGAQGRREGQPVRQERAGRWAAPLHCPAPASCFLPWPRWRAPVLRPALLLHPRSTCAAAALPVACAAAAVQGRGLR